MGGLGFPLSMIGAYTWMPTDSCDKDNCALLGHFKDLPSFYRFSMLRAKETRCRFLTAQAVNAQHRVR